MKISICKTFLVLSSISLCPHWPPCMESQASPPPHGCNCSSAMKSTPTTAADSSPERVIFSFISQAFGPTPISRGPWPPMSAPGDTAANDAPRGLPQSAPSILFSILEPSNHHYIHNSYTLDLEVKLDEKLVLNLTLYWMLFFYGKNLYPISFFFFSKNI